MTYELPAIGRPPDGPPLEKIAVEEHFDALGSGARRADAENEDLQSLVKAMEMALGGDKPEAAQLVATECVVLAETKDAQTMSSGTAGRTFFQNGSGFTL